MRVVTYLLESGGQSVTGGGSVFKIIFTNKIKFQTTTFRS